MADWLGRHEIDCLKIVPSHLAALLQRARHGPAAPPPGAGRRGHRSELAAGLRAELAPGGLLNHYGPTETTVGDHCTYRVGSAATSRGAPRVPLGRPLANTPCLPAGRRTGEPVPLGVPGELYIGGDGAGARLPRTGRS